MAEPITHTIQTTHIQRLIKNALLLAEMVHGQPASYGQFPEGGSYEHPRDEVVIAVPLSVRIGGEARPEHMLCKAISDLRHAADELDAERLSCFGWRQV